MKLYQFKKIVFITLFAFILSEFAIFCYFFYNNLQIEINEIVKKRENLEKDLYLFLQFLQKEKTNTQLLSSKYLHKMHFVLDSSRSVKEVIKNEHIAEEFLVNDPVKNVFMSLFPSNSEHIGKIKMFLKEEKNEIQKTINNYSLLEQYSSELERYEKLNNFHKIINTKSQIKIQFSELISNFIQFSIINKQLSSSYQKLYGIFSQKSWVMMILLSLLNAASFIVLIVFITIIIHSPLSKLADVSRKINQGEISLKKIHTPNLGQNIFGEISLAIRTLLRHISEVDHVKGNIMSQVTHDLKSPLSTMKQGIDMLKDPAYGKLTKDQEEIVQLMESGYTNMHKLVHNLLDAARMEYDVISLKLERFDLLKATLEIFEEFRVQLLDKKIKIRYNFHKRQNLGMIGDKERIKDVLRNLLSNAIKFTNEYGKIYVEIDLKEGDVYIKIQDTGVGIPKSELDKIWEKMYRASNSKSMSVKGTGMGLFIVKNIIQMHRGEVFVSSQLGVGTIFEIFLPRILRKTGDL